MRRKRRSVTSMLDCNPSDRDRSRSPGQPRNVITTLHRSTDALVEDLSCPAPGNGPPNIGLTHRFHIVLPLSGSFQYLESSRSFYVGVNQVLLIPPGREYRITHPIEGDRSMAVFPSLQIAEQLAHPAVTGDTEARSVSPSLRIRALSLRSAARQGADPLTLDELSIDFCSAVLKADKINVPPYLAGRGSTIARAKEYLHAHYREPITLAAVASAAGVSPVYLTQLFKRSFGLALHQYVMALRLNEALFAVGDSPDLTSLALDFGFSSHSHFTSVFRSRFGMTPSAVRQSQAIDEHRAGARAIAFPERPLCAARGGGGGEPIN
jgi:AraC family transcriptional regulator